jgi:hypothetical protein
VPLKPVRDPLKTFRYAVYFDGVDDYAVIPLTVYGWPGITIQEWIYPYHPKANSASSKFSMIGDIWVDYPCTAYVMDNRFDYTYLEIRFHTRRPDGTRGDYKYSIYAYRNTWVNVARRFRLSDRLLTFHVNASIAYTATVPSTEATILEWNPDTATYPQRYKQFVLGANVLAGENMKVMQYQLLIYTRALSDSEIAWNFNYPDNPVRDGLYVWLRADPQYVRDIDGDGIPEWIDLSGNNNHGKVYGATLVKLIRDPVR